MAIEIKNPSMAAVESSKPDAAPPKQHSIPGAGESQLAAEPAASSRAALSAAMEENATPGTSSDLEKEGEEVRTVFQDPVSFNVKHPLFNEWTLWFDNPNARGSSSAKERREHWGANLHRVVDLHSVEEFWGLYNNIVPPSSLPQSANYYLFKVGIQPAWEDPANGDGGKWSVQLPREKHRHQIDKLWLYTVRGERTGMLTSRCSRLSARRSRLPRQTRSRPPCRRISWLPA